MDKSELESAFSDLIAGNDASPTVSPSKLELPGVPKPVTFVPSQVVGLPKVSLVTVDSESIIFHSKSKDWKYSFASIGRRQEPLLASLFKRCTFRRPWAQLVADRSWCIDPAKAYFVFYTNPKVTVYMPAEDVTEYGTCCFSRIRDIIHSGQYATFDIN